MVDQELAAVVTDRDGWPIKVGDRVAIVNTDRIGLKGVVEEVDPYASRFEGAAVMIILDGDGMRLFKYSKNVKVEDPELALAEGL